MKLVHVGAKKIKEWLSAPSWEWRFERNTVLEAPTLAQKPAEGLELLSSKYT